MKEQFCLICGRWHEGVCLPSTSPEIVRPGDEMVRVALAVANQMTDLMRQIYAAKEPK